MAGMRGVLCDRRREQAAHEEKAERQSKGKYPLIFWGIHILNW